MISSGESVLANRTASACSRRRMLLLSTFKNPLFFLVFALDQGLVPHTRSLASRSGRSKDVVIRTKPLSLLPYSAYALLNHEFDQSTSENSIELTCGDKQRNRENLNFKSVASTIPPHRRERLILIGLYHHTK